MNNNLVSHPLTNVVNNYCIKLRTREQVGGTCWFHTALNGWILSSNGRKLLKRYLARYKRTPNYAKTQQIAKAGACPRPGTFPMVYFWAYVDTMLGQVKGVNTVPRFNANLPEYTLVENTGARKTANVPIAKFIASALKNRNYNNELKTLIKAGITILNTN